MIRILKKYGISIFLSILISIACFVNLSSAPAPPMSNFDKLAHFVMFFLLGLCVYFENTNRFKFSISYQRILLGSFLFPVCFSGLIEIVQEYLVPYRSGDWMDFLWDMIGAFFALAVCLRINRKV